MLLNRLLPGYLECVLSGDSAFVRILGVFQVQCIDNYCTNIILMENVSTSRGVVAKYDLKGSLFSRRTSQGIGKDCNFLDEVGKLTLTPKDSAKLIGRLTKEGLILSNRGLMDYSLLVTICQGIVPDSVNPNYLYMSSKSGEYYLIALIDFFQEFNLAKKLETLWKVKIKRVAYSHLSSIEPRLYYERFIQFIESIVYYKDKTGKLSLNYSVC